MNSGEWFTARELARLPGMPRTARSVRRIADREHWTSRRRKDSSHAWEYPLDSLPGVTRREILKHQKRDAAQAFRREKPILKRPKKPELSGDALFEDNAKFLNQIESSPKTARRFRARKELAKFFDAQLRERPKGWTKDKTAKNIVIAYESRALDDEISPETRAEITSFCAASLQQWLRLWRARQFRKLGGLYGNRKGSGLIEEGGALYWYIVSYMAEHPSASVKAIHKGAVLKFGAECVPSVSRTRRFCAKHRKDHPQEHMKIRSPEKYRSKYESAAGSASEEITSLNQVWEMDSTIADVIFADGRRYALIGVIDVYSRRAMLQVTEHSNSPAISLLLKRGIKEWGVPEAVRIDNGKDYVSNQVEEALFGLGCEKLTCQPFEPKQKPFVERLFKTFLHDVVPELPGYCGHNVAERQEIRARGTIKMSLTPERFQEFADNWCANPYARDVHTGFDGELKGKTPDQVAREWMGEIRRPNERALDALLSPAPGNGGIRIVTKKGIRVEGHTYWDDGAEIYIGQEVKVKFANNDLGTLNVHDLDGRYLFEALCEEVRGISAEEAIRARKRQNARVNATVRNWREKGREYDIPNVWQHKEAADKEAANKVVAFERPGTPYSTPALDGAAEAAEAMDCRVPVSTLTPEQESECEDHLVQLRSQNFEEPLNADEREMVEVRRILVMKKRRDEGEKFSPQKLEWLDAQLETPAVIGFLKFCKPFGLEPIAKIDAMYGPRVMAAAG